MKNRIWKQIRRTSIAAVAAGTVLVGNIQPGTVLASAFQSGPNPKVEQSCFWTDRGNGRAGYPDHGIKGLDNGKKDFGRQ